MGNIDNPCYRCGKQRIEVNVKKENVGGSVVITTVTTCPDPECQKLLDKQMENEKSARERLIGSFNNQKKPFESKRTGIVLKKKIATP